MSIICRFVSILLLSVWFITGCINEDDSNCAETHDLYFMYKGDADSEVFFKHIGRMSLYIYKSDGSLYSEEKIETASLGSIPIKALQLPQGRYNIVCWGNVYENTEVRNASSLLSAELSTPNFYLREPITSIDSIYFGTRNVEIKLGKNSTDTVYFSSAHTKFNIYLMGIYPTTKATTQSMYYVKINNIMPLYSFSKRLLPGEATYFPVEKEDAARQLYTYTLNTTQIHDDNAATIDLVERSSNKTIYTLNLKDYMTQNSISIDGKNEAVINVMFKISGIQITVLPWDEEIIYPGN